MEGPKQAVHRRKPTNITEFKWFCTKEWDKTPTCYCAGLFSIYKKLYLQLLQQKGVTPDTESKDSHTFATHRYVTLDHFFSINKWQRKYFSLICLIRFSLSTFRTYMKIWLCFGSYLCRNIENSKGFTNFQAALYESKMSLYRSRPIILCIIVSLF